MNELHRDSAELAEYWLQGRGLGQKITDAILTKDVDIFITTIEECAQEIWGELDRMANAEANVHVSPIYTVEEVRDMLLAQIDTVLGA
jgi:hypothetical protein